MVEIFAKNICIQVAIGYMIDSDRQKQLISLESILKIFILYSKIKTFETCLSEI